MAKRKLDEALDRSAISSTKAQGNHVKLKAVAAPAKPKRKIARVEEVFSQSGSAPRHDGPVNVQIITGSYERVLHGFAAALPVLKTSESKQNGQDKSSTSSELLQADVKTSPSFTDTFLFNAHSSAIRCLALSHSSENQRRVLATGSTDERINLYHVSTVPPAKNARTNLPTLSRTNILENPRNRELGSLLHHSRSVTKLQFPTQGKLFSAAEDNTVAISRVRDWTVLSTIKAPIPKPVGRPSGDTAALGEIPAGVNDFAVHPGLTAMISVSKGERCMRSWDIVRGKKGSVLNFDKELLQQVGETRYSSGEGRQVLWTNKTKQGTDNDVDGKQSEDLIVGFERGAIVFGIADSKPKAIIRPSPVTKIHQMRMLPASSGPYVRNVLAVSTEDARIIFYDLDAIKKPVTSDAHTSSGPKPPPVCPAIAQIGGPMAGLPGRIKDFEILVLPEPSSDASVLLFIAASSDGAVRLWRLDTETLQSPATTATTNGGNETAEEEAVDGAAASPHQVGTLLGTHETGSRITCLAAFIMDEPSASATNGNDGEDKLPTKAGVDSDDSDSE